MIKRSLVAIAILAFVSTVNAQNQLRDLASRLATETSSVADATYNDYSRGVRIAGNDLNAVMAAYQLSAGAQVFNRLTNDRRRGQELQNAFRLVQDLARDAQRTNLQRNRWSDIERLLSDISRELSYGGDSGNPGPFPFPGESRSGRMNWRGRVDDDIRIVVRGGTAQVETIGGTPYYDAVTNFTNALPSRGRVTVTVVKRRGRGEIFIEQQPSRENDWAAIVRIRDPRGGAADYEFDLTW